MQWVFTKVIKHQSHRAAPVNTHLKEVKPTNQKHAVVKMPQNISQESQCVFLNSYLKGLEQYIVIKMCKFEKLFIKKKKILPL